MEAELLQLARDAVAGLEAGPSWVEIAQLICSVVGLAWIGWGLLQMGRASEVRNREIDVLAESMRENTRVIGQGLERQGEAMTQAFTQQGQALDRQGRALERQGEVLGELLRRTA